MNIVSLLIYGIGFVALWYGISTMISINSLDKKKLEMPKRSYWR